MLSLGKVRIHPGFWGMLFLVVLAGAEKVMLPVCIAALCHEIGHLVVLRVFGVHVEGISFTGFGVEIRADTRYLSYWKDILCTLAGPFVNLFLAVVAARISKDYLLSGANLLQGVFNMLPVSGLDGSRALHLFLSWIFDPIKADRICRVVELSSASVICLISLYLVIYDQAGLFLLMASFGIFQNTLRYGEGK